MTEGEQTLSRFTLRQPSPADARFDLHSFDAQIGQPVLVTLPGPPPRTVERRLVAAVVAEDGSSAELTFESAADDTRCRYCGQHVVLGKHGWRLDNKSVTGEHCPKAPRRYHGVDRRQAPAEGADDPNAPVPRAVVGAQISPEQKLAVEAYRLAHGNPWAAQTPTAAMANEAIDWWNSQERPTPIDLTAPVTPIEHPHRFLNLARVTPGHERACSLHPDFAIGEGGCPACWQERAQYLRGL